MGSEMCIRDSLDAAGIPLNPASFGIQTLVNSSVAEVRCDEISDEDDVTLSACTISVITLVSVETQAGMRCFQMLSGTHHACV